MAAARFSDRARLLCLVALLGLGACTGAPRLVQGPEVPLPPPPPGTPSTAGDPGRGAVLAAVYAFTRPERLHGNPAAAARAVADLEWMAATLPFEQQWIAANPATFSQLNLGRDEVRAALGLDGAAPPDRVAAALGQAAVALDRQDRAAAAGALAPVAPGGGQGVLRVLDSLPRLPRAAEATSMADREMLRLMQDDPLS
jgi:hypothetical protein